MFVMIEKNIFSFAASIIKFFIIYFFFLNANASTVNKKYYPEEQGLISIMYHRFGENKYPSTNIAMDTFEKHMQAIKKKKLIFLTLIIFQIIIQKLKKKKKY
tara:strand:- start:523 stop:828 length:306 start_codon:yes stop_codon:yes gene_type:complete